MVSAALLRRYGGETPLRYWKPIQTGIEQDDDTAEVRRLTTGMALTVIDEGVRLPRPVSPHLAASLAGMTIDLADVVAPYTRDATSEPWIVEGAGGVLVPINETALMIDLMATLRLAVVVVARSALGTINHTLLTLESLRARAIQVAGVVMVGVPSRENHAAVEQYGNVRVIGDMPHLDPLDANTLGAWVGALDPDATVREYL